LFCIRKTFNSDIFVVAQREAAIVTPIPGTTRDILELSLDIGGLPVVIADTAGLRKTEDVVEKIGIERATKAYVYYPPPHSCPLALTLTIFGLQSGECRYLNLCAISTGGDAAAPRRLGLYSNVPLARAYLPGKHLLLVQ
jgi:hypothetical protein